MTYLLQDHSHVLRVIQLILLDPDDGGDLLAENIVYDAVTNHYWMVVASYRTGQFGIALLWSDNPVDPTQWTFSGYINIGTQNECGSFAPRIVKDGTYWYIFYSDWSNPCDSAHSIYFIKSTDDSFVSYGSPVKVLSPTQIWEDWRVDEPYVFKHPDDGGQYANKWIIIYMGDKNHLIPINREQIGFAYADNIEGPYTKFPGNPCIGFSTPNPTTL